MSCSAVPVGCASRHAATTSRARSTSDHLSSRYLTACRPFLPLVAFAPVRTPGSQHGVARSLKVLSVWHGYSSVWTNSRKVAVGGVSEFGRELARLMGERGTGVRELARLLPCKPGPVSHLRSGKARPAPELAQILDDTLRAGRNPAALAAAGSPAPP